MRSPVEAATRRCLTYALGRGAIGVRFVDKKGVRRWFGGGRRCRTMSRWQLETFTLTDICRARDGECSGVRDSGWSVMEEGDAGFAVVVVVGPEGVGRERTRGEKGGGCLYIGLGLRILIELGFLIFNYLFNLLN